MQMIAGKIDIETFGELEMAARLTDEICAWTVNENNEMDWVIVDREKALDLIAELSDKDFGKVFKGTNIMDGPYVSFGVSGKTLHLPFWN